MLYMILYSESNFTLLLNVTYKTPYNLKILLLIYLFEKIIASKRFYSYVLLVSIHKGFIHHVHMFTFLYVENVPLNFI